MKQSDNITAITNQSNSHIITPSQQTARSSFSGISLNPPSTWLNIETQSLKNEVSELQKILDEINLTTRGYELQSKNLVLQQQKSPPRSQSNSPLTSSRTNLQDNKSVEQRKKGGNHNKSLENTKRVSNLKQPTKIIKTSSEKLTNHETMSKQSSNATHKAKYIVGNNRQLRLQGNDQQNSNQLVNQFNVAPQTTTTVRNYPKQIQQQMQFAVLDDSIDTSIKKKFDNIIKNLDAEINNECSMEPLRIKNKQQQLQQDSLIQVLEQEGQSKDRHLIEDELEKMKLTLELIKEQELLLISRMSQDQMATTLSHHQAYSSFDLNSGIGGNGNDQVNQTFNKIINTLQNDSSLLVIESEDPYSENSFISSQNNQNQSQQQSSNHQRQHHRRISRQSFGCRSLQDLKNSFKDSQPLIQSNQLFNLDLCLEADHNNANHQVNVDLLDVQLSTPRTMTNQQNLEESSIIQNNLNVSNTIQTPFFSRNLHAKKPSNTVNPLSNSNILHEESIIIQKYSDINDEPTQLRDTTSSQNQITMIPQNQFESKSYHSQKGHCFQSTNSRSNSKNMKSPNDHQNQTPRDSIQVKSSYTSQRSQKQSSNNPTIQNSKSRTRQQPPLDYSKISKHQSIAKLFENRRMTIKPKDDKSEDNKEISEFEIKRSSTQSINNMNLTQRQSINARGIGKEDTEDMSSNRFDNSAKRTTGLDKRAQIINKNFSIEKRKQSFSKEKYSRNNALQLKSLTTHQLTSRQQSSGIHQNINDNQQDQSPNRTSSRFANNFEFTQNLNLQTSASKSKLLPNSSSSHSLLKDRSLVRLRKLELENAKQEKLIQKIQEKEIKIKHMQVKKQEEEKQRKEPQSIYEKTMKLKQRIEDRRKLGRVDTNDENTHNLGDTTNRMHRDNGGFDNGSKTPNRKSKLGDTLISPFRHRDMPLQQQRQNYESKEPKHQQQHNQNLTSSNHIYSLTLSLGASSYSNNMGVLQSKSSNNLTNTMSKQGCENCARLLSKGLSNNFCPHHSKTLSIPSTKHSQQASGSSFNDINSTHHADDVEREALNAINEVNLSIQTFGGKNL